MRRRVLFLAFWITTSPLLYAQYFDKMSVRQRDSVLEAKGGGLCSVIFPYVAGENHLLWYAISQ